MRQKHNNSCKNNDVHRSAIMTNATCDKCTTTVTKKRRTQSCDNDASNDDNNTKRRRTPSCGNDESKKSKNTNNFLDFCNLKKKKKMTELRDIYRSNCH